MITSDLLQVKMDLLDRFLDLTVEQLRLLDLAEYEKMLALFADKDDLIREINDLDQELGLNHNPEILLVKLKKIQELTGRLEEKLQKAKAEIGMKLIKLQQSKQTENKYHHFTQTEGAFIDKKQ